ncbi:hypothetical protein M2A_1176 [Tepidicaulis marinus]|uniref:Uncharacterized protein n=1 Tax=Tepidicaulis marinus TaxID=1333998 RepID=A0A081B9F9_9HYPH|nr:hypothetical protein [Tepidicaulis marinus]GAK44677.1 hypothetical protein M2A_1176 [Tepidicaulis marinus]
MASQKDEISVVIDALGAVRMIRNHYASSAEAATRISDICDMLETGDTDQTPRGIRTTVAKAIRESYL